MLLGYELNLMNLINPGGGYFPIDPNPKSVQNQPQMECEHGNVSAMLWWKSTIAFNTMNTTPCDII